MGKLREVNPDDQTRKPFLPSPTCWAVLLRRRDEPVHLADLARELARERDVEPYGLYVSLYHDHVPRLADAGLLSFDPETKLVSFR